MLFHKLPVEGKKVACVVSGGNIDVNILNRVITRGLVMSGRKANMTIALEDKPGQLKKVAEIVSRCEQTPYCPDRSPGCKGRWLRVRWKWKRLS